MAKLSFLFVIILFFALAHGLKWKIWQPAIQIPRKSVTLQTPSAASSIWEVRGVSTALNPGRGVLDSVDFIFSIAPIPHFTVRHYDSAGNVQEQRAARLSLVKLLEFSGPFFDPDNTTIVSSYPFWNATWNTVNLTQQIVNNGNLWTASVSTVDGIVTVNAYYSDNATTLSLNGTTAFLDNNAIHFTLLIKGYAYAQAGTKLALKVLLESETTLQDISTSGTESDIVLVTNAADPIRPVAVWAETVQLSGNGCSATGTVQRDILRNAESPRDTDLGFFTLPTETTLTLNAPHLTYVTFETKTCQPASIFWDPDLGIQDNINGVEVSLPSLLLVIALCALFLF